MAFARTDAMRCVRRRWADRKRPRFRSKFARLAGLQLGHMRCLIVNRDALPTTDNLAISLSVETCRDLAGGLVQSRLQKFVPPGPKLVPQCPAATEPLGRAPWQVAQPQATLVAVLLGHGPAVLRAERAKPVFGSGIAAALSCPAAAARAARSGHRLPGHDQSRQLKKHFRQGWFWLIQTSLAASDSPGPSPKQKGGTLVDCSMRVKDAVFCYC